MTKVKMIINLVVICFVAAAGLAVYRAIPLGVVKQTDDKHLVTFTVIFTPAKPDKPVNIFWQAGLHSGRKQQEHSPFIREYMLTPGSRVELLAEHFAHGLLKCRIRKGLNNIDQQEHEGFAGGVACRGTA